MLLYKFVNPTTAACKSKRITGKSNSQSISIEKSITNFYFSSCCGDDVTRRATGARLFRLKMVVDNVAVTRLCTLAHNNVCRVCVSALSYYTVAYKYLRNKISVHLRNSSFAFTALNQDWVQLHKITSITITITLKYQLQLQLQLHHGHHHNVILNYNYNYTMFISITITITVPFLHKLPFYLWNCGLIGFGCFPCLACCLVPTQPRNALWLHNIATSDSI